MNGAMDKTSAKHWEDFRDTGLLLYVNVILQLFGWSLFYQYHDGVLVRVEPKRTNYDGFSYEDMAEAHAKVRKCMKELP